MISDNRVRLSFDVSSYDFARCVQLRQAFTVAPDQIKLRNVPGITHMFYTLNMFFLAK